MTDEDYMRQAIAVADANPRHPFGAIIVDRDAQRLIAEGVNQSSHHPMWHGEIVAINDGVTSRPKVDWSKLTLFTTAEPCPMCMSAILWCGIRSVVYGTSILKLMELGWDQINIRATDVVGRSHKPKTEVVAGVLEYACNDLFERVRRCIAWCWSAFHGTESFLKLETPNAGTHQSSEQYFTKMRIDNPDVILIGSGIMSANLGAMLKRLQPELRIQLYEASDDLAQESSNAWNNAGTGHAGICELSYTPNRNADGTVDVSNAVSVFEQFEQSRQFWAYAVAEQMIDSPRDFINQVPHISFVHGQSQVAFLKARHSAMSSHHFFEEMAFTTDRDIVREWAPLLVSGRDSTPVAATRMVGGTDVDFGSLSSKLINWMATQDGCGVSTGHRVTALRRTTKGWDVTVRDSKKNRQFTTSAKFVFVGAGGGSLPLLQKSGIPEGKGFGGFPIGGQWLVCDNPEIVQQHQAKVYGQAQGEAPTMAVPHLDTRVIDGKKAILFGPFAAWTTRFLKDQGSLADLPFSIRPNNIASLLKVGAYNLPLVKYLVQQGLQSMESRMKLLRTFYPEADVKDWRLIDAGIRVQAIKREDGEAGIVHYGTEIVTDKDKTIAALLGASPGASVSVSLMLQIIKNCLPELLQSDDGAARMKQMIRTHDVNLKDPEHIELFHEVHRKCDRDLQLASEA